MHKDHHYQTALRWTGNKGTGTSSYTAYDRNHVISVENKPDIPGSSDPAFRGDASRYNPEEMLVASLSACHMLWYLHLCADAGVVVTAYEDKATGTMVETSDGKGHLTEVVLNPLVTVSDSSMLEKAQSLHQKAHSFCYIANSCNFPVRHIPQAIAEK